MSRDMRAILRDLTPPGVLRAYRRLREENVRFTGDYGSWQEAKSASRGYDDASIIERVKQGLLQVQAGMGGFERDGVVLPQKEYDFPLLAALLHVAATRQRLHVVDFGGSLGSTYFQHRALLRDIPELTWQVVEQPHFVECGRETFADEVLSFRSSLQECFVSNQPNVILLSSVLPYVPEPYPLIRQVSACGADFVLVNRTPVLSPGNADLLAVQHVAFPEYRTSYPAWLLDRERLFDAFTPQYQLVVDLKCDERWSVGNKEVLCAGGLLQRLGSPGLSA